MKVCEPQSFSLPWHILKVSPLSSCSIQLFLMLHHPPQSQPTTEHNHYSYVGCSHVYSTYKHRSRVGMRLNTHTDTQIDMATETADGLIQWKCGYFDLCKFLMTLNFPLAYICFKKKFSQIPWRTIKVVQHNSKSPFLHFRSKEQWHYFDELQLNCAFTEFEQNCAIH